MSASDEINPSLRNTFDQYVGRNEGGLPSRAWIKLLKETQIVDQNFTTTDADLAFAKVKAKGGKGIDFRQFLHALELVAQKKKLDHSSVIHLVTSTQGPTFTGTKADSVRLHDDKALYTGVHARGGPSTVDIKGGKTFSEYKKDPHGSQGHSVKLEDLCNRSKR